MKRLPFFIVLVFAIASCQNENNKELEAILEYEILQEKVQHIAEMSAVEMTDIMSDINRTSCEAIGFQESLDAFIAANQQKANETCENVKGFVSGCYEGYMTYATAMVFPDPSICRTVKVSAVEDIDY